MRNANSILFTFCWKISEQRNYSDIYLNPRRCIYFEISRHVIYYLFVRVM